MTSRRDFIKTIGLTTLGLSASTCLAKKPANKQPNFLFIITDDLGCVDLGVLGSKFHETPNLDKLANSGMRFTQGYATCPVCSPSRGSIMTGKYTPRHGITDWIGAKTGMAWNRMDKVLPAEYVHAISDEETTMAEALKEGGYTTFFAGKWHLGHDPKNWPEHHGFDINKGGWGGGSPRGGYFDPYNNPRLENRKPGEYLPHRLAEETIGFLEQHKGEKFLAYLSFYAVHGPIQTTKDLWDKYRKKAAKNPHKGDRYIIDRTLPVRQVQDNPIYAGLMEAMDTAVGMVLNKLEELGLADNTVVFFTGDNGGVSSGDNFSSCNLPFRGGKGRQWEGGIREPFFIRAPGITKPGSICNTPVIGTDFYPTMLDLAGLPMKPEQHVDGVSLVPLLKGASIKERDLFWHYPHYGNQGGEPSSIIRSGDWKMIHYYEDGRDELYNLAEDIGEQNDLADKKKDIAKTLRAKLDDWLKDVGAKIPQPDPRWKPEFPAIKREQSLRKKEKLEEQGKEVLKRGWKPDPNWYGSIPQD